MSKKLLDPIRRSRISEQVADKLADLIRTRKLLIGEQLPSERRLMEMLGVGRGAVREALRILEIKGYVETRHGVGAFVKDSDGDIHLPLSIWLANQKDLLANFFEIRLFLEPNAAALAAARITGEQLEELRKVHEDFCKCVETGDLPKAILVDAKFHKVLAQSTQNKLLELIMVTLNKSVIVGWKASLRVPGRAIKTVSEHRQILAALETRNAAEAARVMRKHLEEAVAELKEQGMEIAEGRE